MEQVIPYFLFDATSSDLDELIDHSEKPTDSDKGKKLRCWSCRQVITDEGQRMSVNGSHSHQRTNPNGIHFHFECFKNAPGCAQVGEVTREYSWFNGYRWQISICKGCGEHLGWLFKGENFFYALIKKRLIPGTDE